jgi:hypothetical protein
MGEINALLFRTGNLNLNLFIYSFFFFFAETSLSLAAFLCGYRTEALFSGGGFLGEIS